MMKKYSTTHAGSNNNIKIVDVPEESEHHLPTLAPSKSNIDKKSSTERDRWSSRLMEKRLKPSSTGLGTIKTDHKPATSSLANR